MKKNFYDFASVKRACIGMSLCCMVAGVQAASTTDVFAQRFDVELSLNNTTLKAVVNSLKQQTDIVFSYDTALESLRVNKVSVKAKNKGIEAILEQAFRGTEIKYKIEDRIVLIYKEDTPVAKANAKQQITKKISEIGRAHV